jgi:TDG/mug DNA glycosylase family protein
MQKGLAPVISDSSRVLLLGSFPSEESLRVLQYYANPRNQFWKLVGAVFGAHPELTYPERIEILKSSGVALWDVLGACERKGSLDAAIDLRTAVPNDIPALLAANPSISVIGLNGGTAADTFRRRFPALWGGGLRIVSLPSSSSAHAAMSLAAKVAAWSALQGPPGR